VKLFVIIHELNHLRTKSTPLLSLGIQLWSILGCTSSLICHGLIIVKLSLLYKAKRTLNFLHHSLWGATTAAKSVIYKSLIRPILEYACQVWSPHTAHDISTLENVQHHAARWACGSRWDPTTKRWNKSSNYCVDELHWPTLTDRCNYLHYMTYWIREHPWLLLS